MHVKRNILYAERPTLSGKVFTTICLTDLAREINENANKHAGYTLDAEDDSFYLMPSHMSHKIEFVVVEGLVLVAHIETLGTKSGIYLEKHLKEYVFRPQATFFETNERFFSIQHFDAIAAIKPINDCYDSINVLWLEHIATVE